MIEDFQDSYKGIMTDFSSNICGGNRNVCGDRQNKHLVSVSVQCALTIYKWTGYEFQASPGLYGPMPTGLNAASFEVQTVDGSQVRARITIWAPWEQLGFDGVKMFVDKYTALGSPVDSSCKRKFGRIAVPGPVHGRRFRGSASDGVLEVYPLSFEVRTRNVPGTVYVGLQTFYGAGDDHSKAVFDDFAASFCAP